MPLDKEVVHFFLPDSSSWQSGQISILQNLQQYKQWSILVLQEQRILITFNLLNHEYFRSTSDFTESYGLKQNVSFLPRGGDSHMKKTGMLVGNFEFNP